MPVDERVLDLEDRGRLGPPQVERPPLKPGVQVGVRDPSRVERERGR